MLKHILLLASVAAVPGAASAADPTPARVFGARESVESVDLSPDGTKVVYVGPGAGPASMAVLADVATGKTKPVILSSGKPDVLDWCRFAGNNDLVCEVGGTSKVDGGTLASWSRLLAISEGDTKPRMLGQRSSSHDARLRQYDGTVIDWLPDEGGAVLMSRDYVPEEGIVDSHVVRTDDGLGVDRINLKTLKATRVERPLKETSEYISDGHGHVRIMRVEKADSETGTLSGKTTYFYRRSGATAWQEFSQVTNDEGLVPIAVDISTDSAYALKKLNGRTALYRVKLDGSLASEMVFSHPRVDVDGVVRIGRSGRVIGVTFAEEKRQIVYFDPEYQKLAAALSKALPKLPIVQFAAASADANRLVIFAGSDSDPGRYFLYDKKTHALSELMLVRPDLEKATLASVKPVTYRSGDATIPGYLTLPPGKEDAKGLPAIVLPHGGPSARDEWGFDWLSQFLASQGYAVLQPNYRGSAGYGDAWLNQNGFKGWRTSIGDITAGAKWLVDSGIADPKHLSIVGWSYGGYAALQSAVVEPTLYKAVVAVAPVTDLALTKAEAQDYTNSRLVEREIGSGPHVREGSPLQNVEKISAPVLMFHGDSDLNVDIEQSRRMDKAMRSAGKNVELIVYPGLTHSLVDSEVRAQMLEKIAAFLTAHGGK